MLVLLITVGLIVGIFIACALWAQKKKTHLDKIARFCAFFSILVLFTGLLITSVVPSGEYSKWKEKDVIDIVALNNNEKNLKFVKKTNSEITFRYYSESEFGEERILKKIKLNENIVIVFVEEKIENPHLIIKERNGNNNWIFTFETLPKQTKYIFYVPKGSLIEEKK